MQAAVLLRGLSGALAGTSYRSATSAFACAPRRAFAKPARGGDEAAGDARSQQLLKVLEPQGVAKVERTDEELADARERAKAFSRAKMAEHRAWQRELSTKLRRKREAVEALPEPLRAAALVPDMTPFPLNRMMWLETPPIKEAAVAKSTKDARGTGRSRNIGTKRR